MSRRRKHKHEEHQNHEAWAIPYGDLVTLLLAFFVVLYAISSVNEGKYRVLSDALFAAFRGTPRSMQPIQVGEKQVGSGADIKTSLVEQSMLQGQPRSMLSPIPMDTGLPKPTVKPIDKGDAKEAARAAAVTRALERVADEVVRAMEDLVRANLVVVRRKSNLIEVEIRTDILFPSGSATLSGSAVRVIDRLAGALRPFPNPVRVEGHTDSRPIKTVAFPSNWELSAARAASVVHVFATQGLDPQRLAVIGLGEFRPMQSNHTVEGRNANRRVVIVVLSPDGVAPGDPASAAGSGEAEQHDVAPPASASLPGTQPTQSVDGQTSSGAPPPPPGVVAPTTSRVSPPASAAPPTAAAAAAASGTVPAP